MDNLESLRERGQRKRRGVGNDHFQKLSRESKEVLSLCPRCRNKQLEAPDTFKSDKNLDEVVDRSALKKAGKSRLDI